MQYHFNATDPLSNKPTAPKNRGGWLMGMRRLTRVESATVGI